VLVVSRPSWGSWKRKVSFVWRGQIVYIRAREGRCIVKAVITRRVLSYMGMEALGVSLYFYEDGGVDFELVYFCL
jgi:hypothetical protein